MRHSMNPRAERRSAAQQRTPTACAGTSYEDVLARLLRWFKTREDVLRDLRDLGRAVEGERALAIALAELGLGGLR